MWSIFRSAAARQLRVRGTRLANSALNLTSRVSSHGAGSNTAVSYPTTMTTRGLAQARGRPVKKTATTSKKPTKKATTTKRAAKKPVEKKEASKKRVKKVQTDEQKRKLEIRELKKVALLKEPNKLPDRSWLVYVAQHLKGTKRDGTLGTAVQELAESYKGLSTGELQRLEAAAKQNKLANDAAYKAWVESYTPIEIGTANKARTRLRRYLKTRSRPEIKDGRQPKRPLPAFGFFCKSRWQSGNFSGLQAKHVAVTLAKEWKSTSELERQPFYDSARADKERYYDEVKSVLKHEASS